MDGNATMGVNCGNVFSVFNESEDVTPVIKIG
jgi:hypothetical protein